MAPRNAGRRLDALIVRIVPGVRKAVKWNSPLYGVEGQGWFLGIHCFTNTVKVAFFRGASLRPVPPGASKSKDTRYLDIHEDDQLDEAQFAAWVKQASHCPTNDYEREVARYSQGLPLPCSPRRLLISALARPESRADEIANLLESRARIFRAGEKIKLAGVMHALEDAREPKIKALALLASVADPAIEGEVGMR